VPDVTKFDLKLSGVAQNNLGGRGPDSGDEEIRYQRVGMRPPGSRPFDLVVRAKGSYESNAAHFKNGLHGSFGLVNIDAPSDASLIFSFEDSQTREPVVLDKFHFTFFDIDQSRKEDVPWFTQEQLFVDGFASYTLVPDTEVAVAKGHGEGALFSSTKYGNGCDNPKDPMKLGNVTCPNDHVVDQRKRSVTFRFENTSVFNAKISATCQKHNCSPRNFLFAGSSSIAWGCEACERDETSCECFVERDPNFCDTCDMDCGPCNEFCGIYP